MNGLQTKILIALSLATLLVAGAQGDEVSVRLAQIQLDAPDPKLVEGARALREPSKPSTIANVARFGYIKRYQFRQRFEQVRDALRLAITSRALTIGQTLDLRKLLALAGAEAGLAGTSYVQGEVVTLCAIPSLGRLLDANPHDIVLCPYSIAVYELAAEPGLVNIAFRRLRAPGAPPRLQASLSEAEALIDEIIESVAG